MGASTFENVCRGYKTAQSAFDAAVEEAQYDYGHAGYTGTIAEKSSFVVISNPPCKTVDDAVALANKLIENCDARIDDKWGPAGCIPVGDDTFVFFGWASS